MSRPSPSTPSTPARPSTNRATVPQTPMAPTLTALTSLPPFSTTSVPRLQALYSDFSRQKHSNPESYNANVDWWRRALEVVVGSGLQQHHAHLHAPTTTTPRRRGRVNEDIDEDAAESLVSASDRLVLRAGRDLMESVKIPKVGKPLALGAVLSELCSTRTALPLSEFLSSKASIYYPGWLPTRIAAYVVGKPLWWALEQMGVVGEEGFLSSGSSSGRGTDHNKDTGWWGDYVLVALVENAANSVVAMQDERMASPGDALYTLDSFRKTFAGIFSGAEDEEAPLRELDAKVLLKFLERDRGVLVMDKDVIKFVDQNASAEERAITAIDSGILELKSAIQNLHTQVESLQCKIDDCTRKASAALQQKRKPVALSYLRSRKQLEDLLNKRLGSLHTLEATFITVETAAGDVEIMKSYESSTATLRAILLHPSLERSSVDKTLEALAEANADAQEVDDAVRLGGNIALGIDDTVDDAELDDELKAMVKESEDAEREKKVQDSAKEAEDIMRSKLDQIRKTPGSTLSAGTVEARSAVAS